jgi:hypothetical protein
MRVAFISLSVLSTVAPVLGGAVQFLGTTLELGGIPYYVPPEPVSQLKVDKLNAEKFTGDYELAFIPFSAVSVNETGSLASTFSDWKMRDDVWSESFLTGA